MMTSLAITGVRTSSQPAITSKREVTGRLTTSEGGYDLACTDLVTTGSVAIVGLGYVGPPTAVGLDGKRRRMSALT